MAETDTPDAYADLLDQYERIAAVRSAGEVLGWDQQVMMPTDGTPVRSRQQSALSGLGHELLTDDAVGAWLDDLAGTDLSGDRAASVREIRREHRRADSVPRELIEELSRASSEALPVWEEAKAEDDFGTFAPTLEELLERKRAYAEHIDPDRDPYEVLFEEYDPYVGIDAAERVLMRLRDDLVPLIDDVNDADPDLADPFDGTDAENAQEAVSREILDALGFDWDRGRLDTSAHPFTSGNQFDCRITTRFHEEDPLDALTATIHEFGHAQYVLGLPREAFGTPLGQARDLVVHESQSRFWENHVARTEAFWEWALPIVRKHFGGLDDASARDLFEAANRIYPDNLVRVEADELTYHMHVVLRFEIERDLIRGEMDVSEVPGVWTEKMEEYLGVRPETDAEGCLQDIHWAHGSFGYFPTYSLGSVLAAQLDHHVRQDLDVDGLVREGEFDPIREWLGEHIHRHGRRYTTPDLIEAATGEAFTAEYFLDYATGKFGDLYGV